MNENQLMEAFLAVWKYPLFTLGGGTLTLAVLTKTILGLVFVWIVARVIRWKVTAGTFAKGKIEFSTRYTISRILYYAVLFFGIVIVLDTAGLHLSSLTIFSGLVGAGIGFGMQNIASNFISGIILLVERPVRSGDVISIGDTRGVVDSISIRMTRVVSFDNTILLIPNSRLVNEMLVSWTTPSYQFRSSLNVVVPNRHNPVRVKDLLLEVAGRDNRILTDPAPAVRFKDMSAATQTYELVVWTRQSSSASEVPSDLRFAIVAHFEENGVSLVTG